ncbi:ATP-binding protein [Aquabacterium sp. A7-Y]|uniref:DAHL domain-containing protein n=1 Tax=Aquabacterium sp. A7-Y TaxID=1349605 RepID=UPI00223CF1FE|nr:DAHL domain-containing protein [Aquabacterium sp. A7-Y]MCW7536944.1 ATP-binding protein [Aquabacterium sp. A7-Y]
MTAWLRLLLTAVVLVLLAAGWTYLYTHSRTVSAERQNETLALLKDLKQIDTDWGADVLRSQAGINRSYDALAHPLQTLAALTARLDAAAAGWGDAALQQAVLEIKAAIDTKSELIDRFKAQNSLLKNSLHYLPTAHLDLQTAMRAKRDRGFSAGHRLLGALPREAAALERSAARQAGGGSDAETALATMRRRIDIQAREARTANRQALAMVQGENVMAQVVNDTLRYHAAPDVATAASLKAVVERLSADLPSYDDTLQEPIGNLVAHAEAVLNLRDREAEVLRQIAAVPVTARIDTLSNGLIARFDTELAQQGRYTRLLLLYSAAVLALVFGAAGFIAYRNATERRRLAELVEHQTRALKDHEVQLIHAQKMNALGEMVAGITHEVNTPLAAVKSGLQSTRELMGGIADVVHGAGELCARLRQPVPRDEVEKRDRTAALAQSIHRLAELHGELASFRALESLDELLDSGMRSVEHISRVIANMLEFSRLDRSRLAPCRVEDAVESTLAMAAHFLGRSRVVKDFGNTRPIRCDQAQINQVLLNLIRNAVQALPASGGTITVRTRMQTHTRLSLAVIDNGPGIAPELLPKIWQPFFTTKKEGAGTGLGLSTSKKIVEAHGGRIEVSTALGVGTSFTVLLPVEPPTGLCEEPDPLPLAAGPAEAATKVSSHGQQQARSVVRR